MGVVMKKGVDMKKFGLIVAVMLFILPIHAHATASLGTISNGQITAYSSPGGNVELKFQFFNKGDENLNIKITYELLNQGTKYDLTENGKNIYVMSAPYPSTFMDTLEIILPPLTGNPVSNNVKEWIALDSGGSYAEVRSAYLYVKIPEKDIHSNPYKIKLVATAEYSSGKTADNRTIQRTVGQQREYIITLYNDARRVGLVPDTTDSDDDGLTDNDEMNKYHTNPYKKDTDEDGISDGDEVKAGTDPLDPKSTGKSKLSGRPNAQNYNMLNRSVKEYATEDANINEDITNSNNLNENTPENSGLKENPQDLNPSNADNQATADKDNKNAITGLATDTPSQAPVNIITAVIIIIGAAIIYRILKGKGYR